MPTLLTATEVRQHVETGLTDDALTRLVEDADSEIIDRLGALASQVDVLDGGVPVLPLSRKASSISSIVERIDQTDYPLADDDFGLLPDGRRVERRQGTSYPSLVFAGRVTITYVPTDETASRKRLLIDLVMLASRYMGVRGESIGDGRIDSFDYKEERNALFAPFLNRNRRLPLA